MSHEITKLNAEIKRLKLQSENLFSMVRNNSVVTAALRTDLESLKAKIAGGAASDVPNRNTLHADPPMHSGVGTEVPK